MSAAAEVSVYDRMCWPPGELERALAMGAHRRELAAFLGAGEYATLSALARQADQVQRRLHSRRKRPARPASRAPAGRAAMTVYLLPGMLGSQLGWPREAAEPPDLLWLDPIDIVNGRLTELSCAEGTGVGVASVRGVGSAGGSGSASASGVGSAGSQGPCTAGASPLQPLGAIVYSYLALKLRLAAAGFGVVLYDYDWRGDLTAAGGVLASRLEAEPAERLALVGHSMGGLLARAALAQCSAGSAGERIQRLVGIGTPHGGSIAAVQALRATYPTVCRLAAIDRLHDSATLSNVFRTFPSLYQMLPSAGTRLDLFDPASWPRDGAQPDQALLQAARGFDAGLASADQRFVCIIGTGQRTVIGVERRGQQFRYAISAAGDGTVAAVRATLPGARNYSLRCEHSELTRNSAVAAGLIDILHRGRTRRLRAGVAARAGRPGYVTDGVLRRALGRKLDWSRMSLAERRRYLNLLNAPPPAYRPPPRRWTAMKNS
jgi:pimeloyl-ACP methyl ester carboxylesterase